MRCRAALASHCKAIVAAGAPAFVHASIVICLLGYTRSVTPAFAVLGEPHRRQILNLLLEAERPVGELVEATKLSQPAVSKHLRVLRDARLVDVRVDAQRRIYRVRGEPLQELDRWLEPYRELWASRLDALERHLDANVHGGEGG